jgi:hypothetical protein
VIKKLDIAAKSDIERLIKKMGDLEKRIKK